jgi:prefoldin subunit 2
MSAAVASSSAANPPQKAVPAPAEINQQYSKFKNDLQALAQKIGELESDVDEHT